MTVRERCAQGRCVVRSRTGKGDGPPGPGMAPQDDGDGLPGPRTVCGRESHGQRRWTARSRDGGRDEGDGLPSPRTVCGKEPHGQRRWTVTSPGTVVGMMATECPAQGRCTARSRTGRAREYPVQGRWAGMMAMDCPVQGGLEVRWQGRGNAGQGWRWRPGMQVQEYLSKDGRRKRVCWQRRRMAGLWTDSHEERPCRCR